MRLRFLQVFVGAWFAVGAARVSADIVFEQMPNQSAGFPSDSDYSFFGQPNQWQRMADDFQLGETAEVTTVVFWGFFYDRFYAPDAETMRVRFLAPRPGDDLPDESAVLYSETFQNPLRQATGEIVLAGPGPPEYRYTIDLAAPFSVSVDTKYWLEVVQLGDPESDFAWESARLFSSGQRVAGPNQIHPNWAYSNGSNLAFQLIVPEPHTLGVIAFGLLFHRRHGRRGARARSG